VNKHAENFNESKDLSVCEAESNVNKEEKPAVKDQKENKNESNENSINICLFRYF
jgi:hypothetical protein